MIKSKVVITTILAGLFVVSQMAAWVWGGEAAMQRGIASIKTEVVGGLVKPGGKVHVKTSSKIGKTKCDVIVVTYVNEMGKENGQILQISNKYHPSAFMEKIDEDNGTYVSEFDLPSNIPPGDYAMFSYISYRCNPIQNLSPEFAMLKPITFRVIP